MSFWSYQASVLSPFLPSSLLPTTVIATTTESPGPTSTTTSTSATVTPTPNAVCYFWDAGWGYNFEIFDIEVWVTDGGSSLHTQEDGCGALTGWSWTDATSTKDAYVYFNLPFFIKDGCVERAIVSAGGPKISCQGQGFSKRASIGGPGVRPSYTDEEIRSFEDFYANATTYYPYVPMDWSKKSITQTSMSMTITSR